MARSWVGLTILACLPCIRIPQSLQSAHSYDKNVRAQECYECVVVSSKNLCPTRLPPILRHKAAFTYEWSDSRTCPADTVLLEPRLIGARRGSREHVGCGMLSSTHVRTIVSFQGGPMPANTTSQPENLRNPYGYSEMDWAAQLDPAYAAARDEVRRLSVGEDGALTVKVKAFVVLGILASRGLQYGVG